MILIVFQKRSLPSRGYTTQPAVIIPSKIPFRRFALKGRKLARRGSRRRRSVGKYY